MTLPSGPEEALPYALPVPDQSGLVHASSIAVDGYAALIFGPSGSGKSDLALRMVDRGAMLVSDDYTRVQLDNPHQAQLIASPPDSIKAKIEVRGIGIVTMPFLDQAPLALAVGLLGKDSTPPRYPLKPLTYEAYGVALPLLLLKPFEVSAAIKLELSIKQAIVGCSSRNGRGHDER